MKRIIFILLYLSTSLTLSAQITQTIKGTITDKISKVPLPGANIVLLDSSLFKGAATDINGKFKLEAVPIGQQNIRITFLGYREKILQVIVSSGKEVVINIEQEESVIKGKELVITANRDKTQTNHKMT